MLHRVLILCALVLASCSPPPQVTPPVKPISVAIFYPPELRPWAERFFDCTARTPGLLLSRQETAILPSTPAPNQVILQWADPPPSAAYASLVGYDRLALIVHAENPISSLDNEALMGIYTGRITDWNNLTGRDLPTQPWSYPASSPLRVLFEQLLLAGAPTGPNTLLAPDPATMLEAVAADPGALGFLPISWLEIPNASTRPMDLPPNLEERARLTVIALTSQEPQGALRSLFICVQNP